MSKTQTQTPESTITLVLPARFFNFQANAIDPVGTVVKPGERTVEVSFTDAELAKFMAKVEHFSNHKNFSPVPAEMWPIIDSARNTATKLERAGQSVPKGPSPEDVAKALKSLEKELNSPEFAKALNADVTDVNETPSVEDDPVAAKRAKRAAAARARRAAKRNAVRA